jgi:uncharacterized cofD-like protein
MRPIDAIRVVALGGGTGLATLLRGLKVLTPQITAIVTVSDDGGSSGRLRQDMGVLPPGDVRNCLVALAGDESLMGALFSYRFTQGDLAGHSFGNLFLAALTEVTGDFDRAVKESSRVLAIRGMVLPSTTDDVRLHAQLTDGRRLAGESNIGKAPVSVERVWLEPEGASALPMAVEQISRADVIVLGPGSLYTSVVPNLLIPEIREAVAAAAAPVAYVANVMTQPGETSGYTAVDHLDGLLRHVGEGVVDTMLVNTAPVPLGMRARYESEGAAPVIWTGGDPAHRGVRIVRADLLEVTDHVRHHPVRLAQTVLELVPDTRPSVRAESRAVLDGASLGPAAT